MIERCEKDRLLKREQLWMNALQTYDDRFGYNVGMIAGTRAGVPMPLSHAERMRVMHLGKPKSAEHKARIGAGNRGKVRTEEIKVILREAATLQFASPEARARSAAAAKLRNLEGNPFKGKKHSDESRALMSERAQARWAGVPRKPRKPRVYQPKPKHLQRKRGPKPGSCRVDRRSLTADQVIAIRADRAAGMSYSELSEKYDLSVGPLHRLIKGKTYQTL